MAREAVKRRSTSTRSRRRGATGVGSADVDRAPGRGKYDRTRSADERQKDQLRRLLDAAAHVFAEMGWAEATVETIVTRAGMSRRTFYEHFDDLKDCLLQLHDRVAKGAVRAVEMQVQGVQDPRELLRIGVTGFLGGIAAFPHIARVVFRVVRAAGPEFEPMHEKMMGRFARLMHEGVQLAYEQGRVKDKPDELRIFALCSAMEAVAMRYVMRNEEAKALDAAPILIDMVTKVFS
jgi:AcrR family transcriptional regulator